MLLSYKGIKPLIHGNTFVAPGAKVIGAVTLKDFSSIWFNSVIRGDVNEIQIGKYSNIQDNCVIHGKTSISDYVTVGHNAVMHGCSVEEHCIIGIGAMILDGAVIGKGSIIAAGAAIKENEIIPPYSLVVGIPGKTIKSIPDKWEFIHNRALEYAALWQQGEYEAISIDNFN